MYKWAVYLNNKCSEEQPEAWSVVGNFEGKKEKPKHPLFMVLTNWKRCLSNNPQNICVFIYLTHQLSGICQTVSFTEPLVWPEQRLSVKRLAPERLLYPSTVQTQGLTRSQQSCKTVAHHASCLQKAKSSMSSISSKQLTWWRKSNNSGNGGDDDIEVWERKCESENRMLYNSLLRCLNIITSAFCVDSCIWLSDVFPPSVTNANILSCKHDFKSTVKLKTLQQFPFYEYKR